MRNSLCLIIFLLIINPAIAQQRQATVEKPLAVLPIIFDGVHVAVKAILQGEQDSLWLLFDTGAEVNVLDNTLASQLQLNEQKQSGLSGFDKVMTNVPVVNIDLLHLGPLPVASQQFYIDDLSSITVNGNHIGGIIGYPFLRNYIVKLDYLHKLLEIYKSGHFNYPKGGKLLTIKMNYYTPTIKASVNIGGETIESRYHITTGGDYGILFNAPFVKDHRLAKRLTITGTETVRDMLKKIQYTNCNIPSLIIGDIRLNNIPASYSPDVNDNSPQNDIAGAIGSDVWKHFTLYINYEEKELYLLVNKP